MAADASPPIYVVDDEPILLELAGTILQHHGYTFKTFTNPLLALDSFVAAQSRPALLITDYAMNPMNGLELTRQFRLLEPAQKVLLVSGTAGEEILNDAASPPDAFLAKPYQAEKFITLVTGLIGGGNA
jgi:CheY-like chemotaxis protein